jgi:hypothetical protein
MTDCAHRVAASRAIAKLVARSRHDYLAQREQTDGRRIALLKLALNATELHAKSLAADMLPRTEDERSQPLLVALTCLQTIRRSR